jgi:hypothetical protein
MGLNMRRLPFVMPSTDVFFAAERRVVAHYFPSFPLSIDNAPSATDYYNDNYLSPLGEGGKFLKQGGYLRARPLPVAVGSPWPAYGIANMETEVRMAIAVGITGFNVDILSFADAMSETGHLQMMAQAAAAVDPRFSIIPMPDMSTAFTQEQIVQIIASCKSPSFFRLPDGRLMFTAFNATKQPLSYWQGVMSDLNAQGVDVAFVPILLGEPASNPLTSVSHGLGDWGTATPAAALSCPPCFMMPVLPQQFRPKDGIFWEASNLDTFRDCWAAANAGALAGITKFVQAITWNDFSESGQVQPFTDATLELNIGTGIYDLMAYYATWFVTGVQPQITKDVLYWCYRIESSTAAHSNQSQPTTILTGETELSNIECLGFLTAAGTIVINGSATVCKAGITSIKVPTARGNPVMALQRDGSDVFRGTCPKAIYGAGGDPLGTTDMTYWSGSHSN